MPPGDITVEFSTDLFSIQLNRLLCLNLNQIFQLYHWIPAQVEMELRSLLLKLIFDQCSL